MKEKKVVVSSDVDSVAPTCNLDVIAAGKLPDRVIKAIDKLEISIDEMKEWERSKKPFHLEISGKKIFIEIKIHLSTKKLLAVVSSLVTLLWWVILNIDKINKFLVILWTKNG